MTSSAFLQELAARTLNSAGVAIALAIVVWMVLKATGQNARTRFVVWFVTLIGMAALPFVAWESPTVVLKSAEVTLPSHWAQYLLGAWALGFLVALCRLVAGVWRVRQLRRSAVELGPEQIESRLAVHLRETAGRAVKLCLSREVEVPAALGFWNPAVVFPEALFAQLSTDEIEVILLHELAHLRRWDDWTNLAQKFVRAVFFFHPAVWWVERRLTLEREIACDDMVLRESPSAKRYATLLLSFTEKLQHTRALAMVQGLLGRACQISRRVKEILDGNANSRGVLRKSAVMLSTSAVAGMFAVTPYLPQVVAFRSEAAPSVAVHTTPLRVQPVLEKEAGAAQVIPAAYHPVEPKPVQVKAKRIARKAPVVRAAAQRQDFVVPVTLVVFQPSDFNRPGAVIWGVYWVNVSGDEQVPSAIVFKI